MTTWVEVNVAALQHNAQQVRALISAQTQLCAVVKGNGYGHGALLAANAFLAGGAARVAVTTVDEACELRAGAFSAPILLLATCAADECDTVVEQRPTPTVSDLPTAQNLAAAALRHNATLPVHLLIDCGMGRDGALPDAAPQLVEQIAALPGLTLEGAYCHFPKSTAPNLAPTRAQLARFLATIAQFPTRPPILHTANSGATLRLPDSRLDMVRCGTLLYGQYPSAACPHELDLQPTWALKAKIVELRRLPAGATISYGSEVTLKSPRTLATLLIGWQHGFTLQPASLNRGLRGLRNLFKPPKPHVKIRGIVCPVVGRVAMQSCVVDVTDVPNVAVGDVADAPARRVTTDRGLPRVAV